VPVALPYTIQTSVPSGAVFTDTHYTSKNITSNTSDGITQATSALTNGSVRINHIENNKVTSSHKITGSGATTVTTDASGNIIISSTDNNDNTTYTAGTGLTLASGNVFNHTNSVTAGNATGSSGTINFGGTITIPKIVYDAQGHITKDTTTTTVTLPAKPVLSKNDTTGTSTPLSHGGSFSAVTGIAVNDHAITVTTTPFTMPTDNDTKNTAGTTNKASTKLFLAGATSQAANP
jgi:hypothetical protein